MAHPITNVFSQARELLGKDSNRRGNVLHFSQGDEILFAGDLHGHRQNLTKIINFAALGAHPNRKLILHELIHGPLDENQQDRSIDVLLRAVRLKLSYPDQVFFLLGNHDVAQVTGNEITKEGFGVVRTFDATMEAMFEQDTPEVRAALYEMFLGLPLVARCPNGVLLSHSLPSPNRMGLLDWSILERPYQESDLRRGGSVYEWTWGREQSASQLADISARLDVQQFLLGHQPVPQGHRILHNCAVILASDHAHGCVIMLDAGKRLDDEELARHVRPIAGL